MTQQDEAVELATRVGRAYCRDASVPVSLVEDCLQEGILEALRVLPTWNPDKGRLITFLFPWVRGAIGAYLSKQQNGGTGGKDAAPRMISLQDEVRGIEDFDGEPLTYEDIVSYPEPPECLGDPLAELLREEEQQRMVPELAVQDLLDVLSLPDRALIMQYFGIDSPEVTQQELALERDVSQAAISARIRRILTRLHEAATAKGYISENARHN